MGKRNGCKIDSADFGSYCKRNNLKKYYTTISDDEVIYIKDKIGNETLSNCLTLVSIDSELNICFNDDDDVLFIPTGQEYRIDYLAIEKFTVLGLAGQKLRYYYTTF